MSEHLHHLIRQHPFTRASLRDDDVTVDFADLTAPMRISANVTGVFGIVTDDFGNVTTHFGDAPMT